MPRESLADDDGCHCEFNEKTWPNILCGMGIGAGGAVTTAAILDLVGLPTDLTRWILDIYCSVLGLLVVLAEARRFKCLRGGIYKIIKHVYFLTIPRSRAIFYFFLGSIMFDPGQIISMATCAYVMVLALLLFIVDLMHNLPQYVDEAELKKRNEEIYRRKVEAEYQQRYDAARGAAEQGVTDQSNRVKGAAAKYSPNNKTSSRPEATIPRANSLNDSDDSGDAYEDRQPAQRATSDYGTYDDYVDVAKRDSNQPRRGPGYDDYHRPPPKPTAQRNLTKSSTASARETQQSSRKTGPKGPTAKYRPPTG